MLNRLNCNVVNVDMDRHQKLDAAFSRAYEPCYGRGGGDFTQILSPSHSIDRIFEEDPTPPLS